MNKMQDNSGLPIGQEPKYTICGNHIKNRISAELIPHDEPIFILRARDIHAADALDYYKEQVRDEHHKTVIEARIRQFLKFADENTERMKEPDTDKGIIL